MFLRSWGHLLLQRQLACHKSYMYTKAERTKGLQLWKWCQHLLVDFFPRCSGLFRPSGLPAASISHSNSHICSHPPLQLRVDLPSAEGREQTPWPRRQSPDRPGSQSWPLFFSPAPSRAAFLLPASWSSHARLCSWPGMLSLCLPGKHMDCWEDSLPLWRLHVPCPSSVLHVLQHCSLGTLSSWSFSSH